MRLNSTKLALTAASFFALAASANATDLFGSADNHPAPPYSWSGLWVGAVGGMNFSNTETDYFEDRGELTEKNLNINGLGAEGLFGEAQIGFDKQVSSNFVVGVFGGFNVSDAEFNASYSVAGLELVDVTTDYEYGTVLGARIGILKGPDTLFYAAGGWAHAQIGDTVVSEIGKDPISIAGPELDGWFGEVGMESRVRDLGDNIYLTVAGRYTDYGAETLWEDGDKEIEVNTDILAVMVGLKAKLGGF